MRSTLGISLFLVVRFVFGNTYLKTSISIFLAFCALLKCSDGQRTFEGRKKEEMGILEQFPEELVCPVCKTNEEDPCILVRVDDQEEWDDERIAVHLKCVRLRYNKNSKVLYQKC